MECKFQVGQRVVYVRNMPEDDSVPESVKKALAKEHGNVQFGDVVTIADILLPDYGINKNAGLRVEE